VAPVWLFTIDRSTGPPRPSDVFGATSAQPPCRSGAAHQMQVKSFEAGGSRSALQCHVQTVTRKRLTPAAEP
jgi:hypothetical protein